MSRRSGTHTDGASNGALTGLFPVERDTITEEQLLQPLLLIERRLHPQADVRSNPASAVNPPAVTRTGAVRF
jgi:hypothetical protein